MCTTLYYVEMMNEMAYSYTLCCCYIVFCIYCNLMCCIYVYTCSTDVWCKLLDYVNLYMTTCTFSKGKAKYGDLECTVLCM